MSQQNNDENVAPELFGHEKLLFEFVCKVAKKGLRCPTNEEFLRKTKLRIKLLPLLAREGYLRIILYKGQLRQVEICRGPAAGHLTKKPPGNLTVIRIIEQGSAAAKATRKPADLVVPHRIQT